jgi:hypothetical protein
MTHVDGVSSFGGRRCSACRARSNASTPTVRDQPIDKVDAMAGSRFRGFAVTGARSGRDGGREAAARRGLPERRECPVNSPSDGSAGRRGCSSYGALGSSLPYWLMFNTTPSLAPAEHYLNEVEPCDEIRWLLFSHGVESIGLAPIDAWKRFLRRSRKDRSTHRRGP